MNQSFAGGLGGGCIRCAFDAVLLVVACSFAGRKPYRLQALLKQLLFFMQLGQWPKIGARLGVQEALRHGLATSPCKQFRKLRQPVGHLRRLRHFVPRVVPWRLNEQDVFGGPFLHDCVQGATAWGASYIGRAGAGLRHPRAPAARVESEGSHKTTSLLTTRPGKSDNNWMRQARIGQGSAQDA